MASHGMTPCVCLPTPHNRTLLGHSRAGCENAGVEVVWKDTR